MAKFVIEGQTVELDGIAENGIVVVQPDQDEKPTMNQIEVISRGLRRIAPTFEKHGLSLVFLGSGLKYSVIRPIEETPPNG